MPGRVARTSGSAPLPLGLAKRFYGSIILLNALNQTLPQRSHASSTQSGHAREVSSDPAGVYRCFVNKLAQICDLKHGGDTVTAIAVLQPGGIEYRLTSNFRNEEQSQMVKTHLADILSSLGSIPDDALTNSSQVAKLYSAIMLKVLSYNKRRMKVYIAKFLGNVEFCIRHGNGDGSPDAILAARHFRHLKTTAEQAEAQWLKVEYATACQALLYAIAACYLQFEKYLRALAKDNRGPTDVTPWTELRHAIGRLHSYSIAVDVMIDARNRWPELFDKGFEITHVPSASRGGNPVRFRESRCTGYSILRSLNAGDRITRAYQECAVQYLDLGVDLDAIISGQIKDENYTTVVHAEANLANSIALEHQDPSAEDPVPFFNESNFGRYIGCSKPTCLLCSLFFEEHPMRFEHRPVHGNAYTRWRAADVSSEKIDQVEARRLLLEGVVTKLTRILSQTILERAGTKRNHDSRQTPTDPFMSLHGSSVRDATDSASFAVAVGFESESNSPEDECLQSSDVVDDDIAELERFTEHMRLATDDSKAGGDVNNKYGGGEEECTDDSDGGAEI